MADEETTGRTIWCTSIFGAKTGRGLVQVTEQQSEMNMIISPDEARDLANNLINAAHAAEHDAFLVDFLTDTVGVPREKAILTMLDMRKWRKAQAEKEREEA